MSFYDCKLLFSNFLKCDYFLTIIIIAIVLILSVIYFIHKKRSIKSIKFNIFNIEFQLDQKNIEFAYKMYIELRTRKIGIPYEEDDIIVEIYDSWYSSFKSIRDLLLNINPSRKNKDIIDIGIRILNEGLRPHLTTWQARFRIWYSTELNNNANNLSPQEIQRKYPHYAELVEDIRKSQREILKFLDELETEFLEKSN